MKYCPICLGQYGQWRSHCPYCGHGPAHPVIRAYGAESVEQVTRVYLVRVGESVDADDADGLDNLFGSCYDRR